MSSVDDIVWIESTSNGGWWTNYVTGWRWANSETDQDNRKKTSR